MNRILLMSFGHTPTILLCLPFDCAVGRRSSSKSNPVLVATVVIGRMSAATVAITDEGMILMSWQQNPQQPLQVPHWMTAPPCRMDAVQTFVAHIIGVCT